MIHQNITTTMNCNNHSSDESHKRKQIQQQLVLIFHACRCQKHYEVNGINPCTNPHCDMMRRVLRHMSECDKDRFCPYSHCSTSKRILSHWKRCGQLTCLICAPIKQCQTNKVTVNEEHLDIKPEPYCTDKTQPCDKIEKRIDTFTKLDVSENNLDLKIETKYTDIRKSLIKKIMATILPLKDCDKAYQDPRMEKVLELVKEYEIKIFRNAKSLDEYYQTSAQYCFAIQKRLNINQNTSDKALSSNDIITDTSTNKFSLNDSNDISTSTVICNKSNYDSDYLKQCKKLLQSEYERQTQYCVKEEKNLENNSKSNVTQDDTHDKKISNKPINVNTRENGGEKVWYTEELNLAFNSFILYIKNNKLIQLFLSQGDGKISNSDNSKIQNRIVTLVNIIKALEENKYKDPWEITDDINLLIKQSFIASKKNRKLKKDNIQMMTDLQCRVDEIMKSLGFCCGKDEVYQPLTLVCGTSNVCTINKDAIYYSYQNESNDTVLNDSNICCEKCFTESLNEVSFIAESNELNTVKKELLIKKKNNVEIPEEFIICKTCKRKWHKVCACFSEDIWSSFICKYCSEKSSVKRENKYTAKRLPTCVLSKFLERRVNDYLKKNEIQSENVTIRVLSNVKKETEVKRKMKNYYSDLPTVFPYRSKAIFAFQEYEGREICFFGLHVQEYGSDCPEPNNRRVYVAYLDSVRFFEPAKHRTKVYYEILVGYLDYVKKLGYVWAHIWACPPSEGDDYIFNIHPPDQKIPKPKRLQEWYCKMLDKGIQELVVNDYKDIYREVVSNNIKSSTEIPYFEGDFWPNAFEDILKEFEEMSLKNKEINDDKEEVDSLDGAESIKDFNNKKPKKRKQKKTTNVTSAKRRKCNDPIDTTTEFFKKVLETMEKHKDIFFTIRLHPEQNIPSLSETVDQDPIIESELMDGRENFLQMARSKHLEFSSLRRTLFSTLVMCYELHMEGKQAICYTCNVCNEQIEIRYHCSVCYEYDLCEKCYETQKHEHDLQMIRSLTENDLEGSESKADNKCEESSRVRVDKLVKIFVHSSSCRDCNCRLSNCFQMKKMLQHCKSCKNRSNCNFCKRVFTLSSLHAKYCTDGNCCIPYCQTNKETLRRNDNKQRLRQKQLIRRRTEIMRFNSNASNISNPSSIVENNQITQSPHIYVSTSDVIPNNSINSNVDCSTPKVSKVETCFTNKNNYIHPKTNQTTNEINMPSMYSNGSYCLKPVNPTKGDVELVESMYKNFMNQPNGHAKFLENLKRNPHLQPAAQYINQRQLTKSMSSNQLYYPLSQNQMMPQSYNARFHGQIHSHQYVNNAHMQQPIMMNGSQTYLSDVRNLPPSKVNMLGMPQTSIPTNNTSMNINRFPQLANHSDNYHNPYGINSYGSIPNQIRLQQNYSLSNSIINQNNQIYPKMIGNQKLNGQNQVFPSNPVDSSVYRQNPNYF